MIDPYQVEWVDRETLAYRSGGLSVLVWVDFERGLFARGRVIHLDSITEWIDAESTVIRPVSAEERQAIVAAVQQYYAQAGRSSRVEP